MNHSVDYETTVKTVMGNTQSNLPSIQNLSKRTIEITEESDRRIENIKKLLPQNVRDSMINNSPRALRQRSIMIDMELIK